MATANGTLPLDGIRVLDCTQWNSGPLAARVFGDLGADVIKIESVQHPDPLRGAAGQNKDQPQYFEKSAEWIYVNRNKRGLTLDLTSEDGKAIFRRLLARADIVAENLRPGVWEGFGLGYAKLKEVNPAVVLVKMPGFGSTGPWSEHACWAVSVDQMSGFSSFTGYAGGPPLSHALWADYANGLHLAFVLLTTLWHRRLTGQGQFVDLSQLEVVTALNAEALIDYQLNGRIWQPTGNLGRLGMSPHGCFPCAGQDHWIAIAVDTDEEWQTLRAVIGEAEWLKDPRFANRDGRHEHQLALHEHIAAWTDGQDKWELTHRLQRAGVPAAAVAYGRELQQDPHLWERGALERVDRAVVGEQVYVGSPFRYSKTPLRTRQPGPTLGQHNHEILKELGFSTDEIRDLEARHIIGTVPLH